MFEGQDPDEIATRLAIIAVEAGHLLRGLEAKVGEPSIKGDGTPTTICDLEAERLILRRLQEHWPGVPGVAEETANAVEPGEWFFLVDPLDGTADYMRHTGEYSVNIALIGHGRPYAAAVSAPGILRVWKAGSTTAVSDMPETAHGPFNWTPARTRTPQPHSLVALVSRRHGDASTELLLSSLSIATRRTASSALKFCLIASGEADVYVRCGPTMEWDTAAGDHILACAGGRLIAAGGVNLTYGHEERGYRNPPFAALGDASLAPRLSLPATFG